MPLTRRELLKDVAVAGAAGMLGATAALGQSIRAAGQPARAGGRRQVVIAGRRIASWPDA